MESRHGSPGGRRPSQADIIAYLRTSVPVFFPELGSSRLDLTPREYRRRSTTELHWFDIVAGDAIREIVVKIHLGGSIAGVSPLAHWPRLEPCPDPETAARAEFEAVASIYSHFRGRSAEGFGAVRALDVCTDRGMVVMERATGVPLEDLLARCHRFTNPSLLARVERACRNAGRWLRLFQSLPELGRDGVYRPRRDDLLRAIRESGSYLTRQGEAPRLVERTLDTCRRAILTSCPVESVMGVGHGDFWAGNVLVDDAGRVSIIDTYARWRTPVYQDAGYFLGGLHLTPRRVFTLHAWHSRRRMGRIRQAFLAG